jgi:uncharacterized protein YjbI with pentapeptide repeats
MYRMYGMSRLRALIVAAFRAAVANKTLSVATVLGLAVAVTYGFLFDWEWKAMIGWKALEGYINPDPDDTTGKKDAVQVYAVIVAGVIASITAAVGLANLRLTRKNLEQQRELEAQRAQGAALQAYYEQIGNLLTEYDLRNTQREEIKELARGQTLTALHEVDGIGKGSLLTFLHGGGLIRTENPAVALTGADLQGVALRRADLREANLQEADLLLADLRVANLREANLQGADLRGADLRVANLQGADLQEADLLEADLQGANLRVANLLLADLPAADLQGANLQEANLKEARLQEADLQEANLREANLQGADLLLADLRGALGITEDQIEWTLGSYETKLSGDLKRPELWSKNIVEQRMIVIEHTAGD